MPNDCLTHFFACFFGHAQQNSRSVERSPSPDTTSAVSVTDFPASQTQEEIEAEKIEAQRKWEERMSQLAKQETVFLRPTDKDYDSKTSEGQLVDRVKELAIFYDKQTPSAQEIKKSSCEFVALNASRPEKERVFIHKKIIPHSGWTEDQRGSFGFAVKKILDEQSSTTKIAALTILKQQLASVPKCARIICELLLIKAKQTQESEKTKLEQQNMSKSISSERLNITEEGDENEGDTRNTPQNTPKLSALNF